MSTVEYLNEIRKHELVFYKRNLLKGKRIIEIGGGTGIQAKRLTDLGFDIISLDLPSSTYVEHRIFPIIEYDGKRLPFASGIFDIAFSSNVLEHIRDLNLLHDEINRVLGEEGYSLHAMPSSTWRFWTIVAHYIDLVQRALPMAMRLFPRKLSKDERDRIKYQALELLGTLRYSFIPPRHGEYGNCITELYTFSRFFWEKNFRRNNYPSVEIMPMKLFYTGYMIMGAKLSLNMMERLSGILGSSCILYKVSRPRGR